MRNKSSFSVAQIGPYPPPYGGVSVHIKRLHRRLIQDGIHSQVYCDPNGVVNSELAIFPRKPICRKPWCYFSWMFEPGYNIVAEIVHLHYSWGALAPSVLAMLCRGKKIVITVHNQMDEAMRWNASPFTRIAQQLVVKSKNVHWIAVSEYVRSQLLARGVPDNKITVLPAFLPPEVTEESKQKLPEDVSIFIAEHSPVLSSYGFRLWLDDQGIDVYGIDMCIELIRELKVEFPRIGLVVCIPDIQLHDYFAELKSRVMLYGLESNVVFVTSPLEEGYPLWQASDLYIRATNTDGDALAIREALSLVVPVVASDASPRPEGVILFRSRDAESLLREVKRALRDNDAIKSQLATCCVDDNFHVIRSLYEGLALS